MGTTVALLVMFNNYMHDLATAVFGVTALSAYLLLRGDVDDASLVPLRRTVRILVRVGAAAFVWILVFGAVRALAYEKYEWVEAAGNWQVSVLVVKHVILVGMTIFGIVVLLRARARLSRLDASS